jgi:predicted kinase
LRDTAILRESLDPDLRRYDGQALRNPFLVVLSGLPGTGKSHFANELVKQTPFLLIGSDRSRKTLVPRPKYTRGEHGRVFAACHRLIEEFLTEGHRVIFDATNLTQSFRQPLYDIADRTGAGLAVVWFTAPRGLVRRRLEERAAGLDPGNYSDADWLVYCRLRPGEEAIECPHYVVDSSEDISPVLEGVVRLVSRPGPEPGQSRGAR